MKKLSLSIALFIFAISSCKKAPNQIKQLNSWIVGNWTTYLYLDTGYNTNGSIHYDTAKTGGYNSLEFNNNGTGKSNGAYPFTYNLSTNIINLYGQSNYIYTIE
jgi:hypothetical protein